MMPTFTLYVLACLLTCYSRTCRSVSRCRPSGCTSARLPPSSAVLTRARAVPTCGAGQLAHWLRARWRHISGTAWAWCAFTGAFTVPLLNLYCAFTALCPLCAPRSSTCPRTPRLPAGPYSWPEPSRAARRLASATLSTSHRAAGRTRSGSQPGGPCARPPLQRPGGPTPLLGPSPPGSAPRAAAAPRGLPRSGGGGGERCRPSVADSHRFSRRAGAHANRARVPRGFKHRGMPRQHRQERGREGPVLRATGHCRRHHPLQQHETGHVRTAHAHAHATCHMVHATCHMHTLRVRAHRPPPLAACIYSGRCAHGMLRCPHLALSLALTFAPTPTLAPTPQPRLQVRHVAAAAHGGGRRCVCLRLAGAVGAHTHDPCTCMISI